MVDGRTAVLNLKKKISRVNTQKDIRRPKQVLATLFFISFNIKFIKNVIILESIRDKTKSAAVIAGCRIVDVHTVYFSKFSDARKV